MSLDPEIDVELDGRSGGVDHLDDVVAGLPELAAVGGIDRDRVEQRGPVGVEDAVAQRRVSG
jgi:hypothetical protein